MTEPAAMHLKIFVEHRDELRGSMELWSPSAWRIEFT